MLFLSMDSFTWILNPPSNFSCPARAVATTDINSSCVRALNPTRSSSPTVTGGSVVDLDNVTASNPLLAQGTLLE